jgi:hypothetical protein
MERLRVENDNLHAALAWSLDETADAARVEVGANMVRALHGFWEARGQLDEGRLWTVRAMATTPWPSLSGRRNSLFRGCPM